MVVATSRILKDLGVKTSFFVSLLPQLACCGGAGDPFWPAGPWAAPGAGGWSHRLSRLVFLRM